MAYKFYLLVGNEELDVSDGTNFGILEADGLGMPPVDWITETGPYQHGITVVDYKLQPRVIALMVDAISVDLEEHFTDRATLIDYLNYSTDAVKLKIEYDDGNTRQIDCHLMGGLSFPSKNMKGFSSIDAVQLIAPDPTFYDPEMAINVFGAASVTSGFMIETEFPTYIGSSTFDETQEIKYEGTWIEYPVITIQGPVNDLVITNIDTGEKLDFTGTDILSSETFEIDCRYGYKTVTDDDGDNRISTLTTDSDLSTFHLDKKVAGETYHSNNINMAGSGSTSATKIYFRYYNRYIGI